MFIGLKCICRLQCVFPRTTAFTNKGTLICAAAAAKCLELYVWRKMPVRRLVNFPLIVGWKSESDPLSLLPRPRRPLDMCSSVRLLQTLNILSGLVFVDFYKIYVRIRLNMQSLFFHRFLIYSRKCFHIFTRQ